MNMQSKEIDKSKLIQDVGFKQYCNAASWSEYNREFFNQLAPKYDYLNQIITFGLQNKYKSKVIQRSEIMNGDLVLDICTGSGDMTLLIAKQFKNCHIIGIDVAQNMLNIANAKARSLTNIEFELGDALNLSYSDHSFDATIMSYGLRNLDNVHRGIQEMIRVTKPGGVINIIDLSKPHGRLNRLVYSLYFEKLMPLIGKYVFHRGEINSFKYLSESNKEFPAGMDMIQILNSCGIKKVKMHYYMNGIITQYVCRT